MLTTVASGAKVVLNNPLLWLVAALAVFAVRQWAPTTEPRDNVSGKRRTRLH